MIANGVIRFEEIQKGNTFVVYNVVGVHKHSFRELSEEKSVVLLVINFFWVKNIIS